MISFGGDEQEQTSSANHLTLTSCLINNCSRAYASGWDCLVQERHNACLNIIYNHLPIYIGFSPNAPELNIGLLDQRQRTFCYQTCKSG